MTIRNAIVSDLPYLYEICNATGFNGRDASHLIGDKNILGHLFVAPYVVMFPDWCWVVLGHGIPVGYFVSTPNTADFYHWMENSWVPPLRNYYGDESPLPKSDFEKMLRGMIEAVQVPPPIADVYPSHIHMDLLPDYQRKGLGSQLFSLYHAKLKENRIRGTHIGVANGNPGAMQFYEKQGYTRIRTEDWGIYFGRSALELK